MVSILKDCYEEPLRTPPERRKEAYPPSSHRCKRRFGPRLGSQMTTSRRLKGLQGNALKAYIEWFMRETGKKDGVFSRPTHFVWKQLELEKMPLDELLKNSAYEMYIRYASRYDNHLFESLQKGERLVIVTKGGKNEMHTKMSI
ncbi:hypothetical protein L915_03349 [Phytophthora nicotianae]|uniref:RxLR effector protein n=3 Tax=Phytophthora nicotianae TaxID=4792 RepID=W2HE09_PHYNI|nr:hypothetical protein L915_03349 [Phytophthora nicotianae]